MKPIYLFLSLFVMLPLSVDARENTIRFSVNQAVKAAVADNPYVKEAQEHINAAHQAVRRSRADLFATAGLNYTYTGLNDQPIMKTAQGETPTAHTRQYAWNLTLTQPLFTGYALSTAVEISKLGVMDRKILKETTILDLARDVKIACYNLLLSRKMLMVAQSEVDSLTAHWKVADRFYNQELIPKNDLLRSEVALADSKQTLEARRADVISAMALLNRLMNADINRTVAVEDVGPVPDVEPDLHSLVESALDRRPVIRGLKNSLEQALLSEKLSKSSHYPTVSLQGRYGRNGDDITGRDNAYTNSESAAVSLRIGWTFFDWGKTTAGVNQARFHTRAIRQKIRGTEAFIRQQVKDTVLRRDVAKKNIQTAEKSLAQARENFRITNVQYAQQVTTSDVVLDARTFLTRADSNYYRSVYGYMASLADLDRAVGNMDPLIELKTK